MHMNSYYSVKADKDDYIRLFCMGSWCVVDAKDESAKINDI